MRDLLESLDNINEGRGDFGGSTEEGNGGYHIRLANVEGIKINKEFDSLNEARKFAVSIASMLANDGDEIKLSVTAKQVDTSFNGLGLSQPDNRVKASDYQGNR